MATSQLYCPACNTANPTQATFCFACAQPLRSSVAGAMSGTLTGLLVYDHLLKQRYRILGQIGKGGFGAVYKAADIQFRDRLVAIKEMSQSGLNPQEVAEATEAFKRESLILAGLNHPNLPRIYDHFSDGGRWYLVMDFIEGETLEQYLHNSATRRHPQGMLPQSGNSENLPVEEVLAIGIQLCGVLDYLHTRQPPIIFRDLKPANVMRIPGGHLYLIDFGIARHFKPGQVRDTMPLGSPGYAAPEQYGKLQTTPRADVYSLGVTLHQLLSGYDPSQTPFRLPPLQLNGDARISSLDTLIKQMVNMDEEKRPASMIIVKQELQRIAAQPVRGSNIFRLEDLRLDQPPEGSLEGGSELQGRRGQMQQMQEPLRRSRDPRPKGGISRRGILIGGLVGLAGIALGGGILAQLLPRSEPVNGNVFVKATPVPRSPITMPYTYPGHSDAVDAVAWSPTSKLIASGSMDGTVQVWSPYAGSPAPLFTYRGHSGSVLGVAWSPDNMRIASASSDRTVQIWEPFSGKTLLTYRGHADTVRALTWSPDGVHIASSSEDHTVQVWDSATGQTLLTYNGHADTVVSVAWSRDGKRIASAGFDGTVQVWDATTGNNVLTYRGHSGAVNAVAWSPDNMRISSASSDRTVQVWDSSTGERFIAYTGHTDTVLTVAWAPNSKFIASGSADKTVQVWEFTTGAPLMTYTGHSDVVLTVAWWPIDATYIASGSKDKTVQVWQAYP